MNINLIEYFESTVQKYPKKDALVDGEGAMSFTELQQKGLAIASAINSTCDTINQPVAVYLPKINTTVASFIGILYSGNTYAPLDVKNPANRVTKILEVLGPVCILTNDQYYEQIRSIRPNATIINIDSLDQDTVASSLNYAKCIDTDPAYILHTSGSTGVPKGVVISHKSIIDFIHWVIATFAISHKEKIGNQAPFIFDNSTLDIYLMVFTGATLYLTPENLYSFPQKLIEYLEKHKINFIFWVPSVLVYVVNMKVLKPGRLPQLKKVLFCGEIMPTKHFNIWKNTLGSETIFANLYGPTEITDVCSYHIIDREYADNEPLPIGIPCRNTDILILKDDLACQSNEHGELCVRGSSLSNGYWSNHQKTSGVFVQNPLNNNYPEIIYRTGDIVYRDQDNIVHYVGRKDFQIKHLGYRIELGEIEHIILSLFDQISVCAVYDQVKKEIVLFYESQTPIASSDFRIKLSAKLLKYMIPTRYIHIDKMPKNASGKIDRSLLKNKIEEE